MTTVHLGTANVIRCRFVDASPDGVINFDDDSDIGRPFGRSGRSRQSFL